MGTEGGNSKEEALLAWGSRPPETGETDECGSEPWGEPQGVDGMRYTRDISQRASNKGGKGRTRDLTSFEQIAVTAKHLTQNQHIN